MGDISKTVNNEPIIVNRYAAGVIDPATGNYTDGALTTIAGELGSIQPITGNEILQVPEGDRQRDLYKIYTSYKLLKNDIVIRVSDSQEYEVQAVQNWAAFGTLQHYKARLSLKDS